MKYKIGVMQGRLVPKYKGRYQAHPVGFWKDEFIVASKLGLDCIEFIFDYNEADENPLISVSGIDAILQVMEQTGVSVVSICADYFMEAPLHSENSEIVQKSRAVLSRLLKSAHTLGVKDIVIPCVDQSSLNGKAAEDLFVKNITPFLDQAEEFNVNLSLETDLAPKPFASLLARFKSDRITVNYDIGNSASLGFDPVEELNCYGDKITDIHIKDRILGGGPVELGTGVAQFDVFFNELKKFNYTGPFIMQAYRDDEGVEVFKKQLDWIKPFLAK
jgi:L-ribulose-5-phosphate 3-epimerase